MNFLYDYFPILCFFIAYKFAGIYWATAIAMIASTLQVGIYWIRHRRFEKIHLVMLILILLLGTSTLLFHRTIFIKWKPTIIYWLFTFILVSSHFFGNKKPTLEKMLSKKITLPRKIWKHINLGWAIFFLIMGAVNLYVAYYFSTNTWVYFKLFGTLGMTLVFAILQGIYIYPHMSETELNKH